MDIKFPILMYHGLSHQSYDTGYRIPGDLVYVVDDRDFERHLDLINDMGLKTILSIKEAVSDSKACIMLSFDDGHESNYLYALPILQKFNMTAVFCITTNFINTKYFLSDAQIKELDSSGMRIAAHGHTHSYLSDLSDDDIRKELEVSKAILEKITGHEIDAFSAPGGRINERVVKIALSLGYREIYTSKVALCDSTNLLSIPRVAIRKTTSMHEFNNIISRSGKYFFKIAFKSKLLDSLKWVLGNKQYEKFRALLLRD